MGEHGVTVHTRNKPDTPHLVYGFQCVCGLNSTYYRSRHSTVIPSQNIRNIRDNVSKLKRQLIIYDAKKKAAVVEQNTPRYSIYGYKVKDRLEGPSAHGHA